MPVHAQILQYRAMSWEALGEQERARAWFVRARDYAQEHAVNQVYFEADAAIARLDRAEDEAPAPVSLETTSGTETEAFADDPCPTATEMAEIRDEMGAMRRKLAPAFAGTG